MKKLFLLFFIASTTTHTIKPMSILLSSIKDVLRHFQDDSFRHFVTAEDTDTVAIQIPPSQSALQLQDHDFAARQEDSPTEQFSAQTMELIAQREKDQRRAAAQRQERINLRVIFNCWKNIATIQRLKRDNEKLRQQIKEKNAAIFIQQFVRKRRAMKLQQKIEKSRVDGFVYLGSPTNQGTVKKFLPNKQ